MAEFCEQCTKALWGEDVRNDFVGWIGKGQPPLKPGHGYGVICEGCGPTLVNEKGECIATDCLGHGDAKHEYDVVRRGGRTNSPRAEIISWADVEIKDEEFGTVVLRVEAPTSAALDLEIPKAVARYWRERHA